MLATTGRRRNSSETLGRESGTEVGCLHCGSVLVRRRHSITCHTTTCQMNVLPPAPPAPPPSDHQETRSFLHDSSNTIQWIHALIHGLIQSAIINVKVCVINSIIKSLDQASGRFKCWARISSRT